MSLRHGSKVKLIEKVDFSNIGDTGVIVEIDYGSEFDLYTVEMNNPHMFSGSTFKQGNLKKKQLERIPGDRVEGETIDPSDVQIGDKIYVSGTLDKGVERPTIGVVAGIKEEPIRIGLNNSKDYTHLMYHTAEGGTIYSTWWGSSDKGYTITLMEAVEEPHPVVAAKDGDSFEIMIEAGRYALYTKYKGRAWIRELDPNKEGALVSVRNEDEVQKIFDEYRSAMK